MASSVESRTVKDPSQLTEAQKLRLAEIDRRLAELAAEEAIDNARLKEIAAENAARDAKLAEIAKEKLAIDTELNKLAIKKAGLEVDLQKAITAIGGHYEALAAADPRIATIQGLSKPDEMKVTVSGTTAIMQNLGVAGKPADVKEANAAPNWNDEAYVKQRAMQIHQDIQQLAKEESKSLAEFKAIAKKFKEINDNAKQQRTDSAAYELLQTDAGLFKQKVEALKAIASRIKNSQADIATYQAKLAQYVKSITPAKIAEEIQLFEDCNFDRKVKLLQDGLARLRQRMNAQQEVQQKQATPPSSPTRSGPSLGHT